MVGVVTAKSAIVSALAALAIATAVSPSRAGETLYEKVGGWTVTAFSADTGFAFCSATLGNGRANLQLATDGKIWQVGVPFAGKGKKVEVYYGFGVAAEVGNFDSAGDGVAVMRISPDQVKAFGSAPSFDVSIGSADHSWKLAGAAAAIAKTRDCIRDRGVKPLGAAPQAAADTIAPLTGKNCPAPGKYRSQNSARKVAVTFFNGGNTPVTFYWIGFDGQWKKYHTLKPNTHVVQQTFATHPWVATDPKGNCHPEVFMPDPKGGDEGNNFQVWFQ